MCSSDLKAIAIALDYASTLFVGVPASVEEFERDEYNGRQTWVITLGFPIRESEAQRNARLMTFYRPPALEYKKIYIDQSTGEVLAMKIRELAAQ